MKIGQHTPPTLPDSPTVGATERGRNLYVRMVAEFAGLDTMRQLALANALDHGRDWRDLSPWARALFDRLAR